MVNAAAADSTDLGWELRTSSPLDNVFDWDALGTADVDPARLERHRVVTATRDDPAYAPFDVLRTRLLHAIKARGWSRIAVTSPHPRCGKTLVAVNLAFAMGRLPACRSVLLDLDLRIPSLWEIFGFRPPVTMRDFLLGDADARALLRRPLPNLAVAVGTSVEPDASEILQHPATGRSLQEMHEALRPDVVIYDMPPLLACDDVVAFLPQIDAVLLVVRGGQTKPDDIKASERLFEGQAPLLGVVLNGAEDKPPEPYGYGAYR
jgi:Mrp family chromosome partitioning ATPase